MALRLFNTASSREEIFEPVLPGRVGMYICGPTTYDLAHVGHAKTYISYDVLKRYLLHRGYSVDHVQNFTNVDENIIRRALRAGVGPLELSSKYIGEFLKDMDSLEVLRADVYPRTTDHVDDCIELTSRLIEEGRAYEANGDVYFDTGKSPGEGRLIHERLEDVVVDDLEEVDFENPGRRALLDFAVWKRARAWELCWDSPWGKGRPGWHTECAVMSRKYLGPEVDIHGGGMDLIFPHHESEAVLAEALTGRPAARYWLHNQFATIGGEKMSKSRGNLVTIREALEKYEPDGLRFYLLSTHYRKRCDFSMRRLETACEVLESARRVMRRALEGTGPPSTTGDLKRETLRGCMYEFHDAMDNDLDVPSALSVMGDMVKLMERRSIPEDLRSDVEEALRGCQEVLGLDLGA